MKDTVQQWQKQQWRYVQNRSAYCSIVEGNVEEDGGLIEK
jgi:hypothetical protein